jgi:DNA-directed RNA polymerase subunit H (RpoH/RPB5)
LAGRGARRPYKEHLAFNQVVGGSNEPTRRRAVAPDVPPGPFRSSGDPMTPSPSRASRARKSKTEKAAVPKRPFVAHHLAPPHEILSEAESKKVLEALGTPPERLPKILVADPGLKTDPRYEAMRESGENLPGRLVRIRRPSATAGEATAYRLIVPSVGGD